MRTVTLSAGVILASLPFVANAQETLSFSSEFVVELQNDYTYDSDDPAAELNDTFLTIEGAFSLAYGNSSLNASTVIEPIVDPVDDRFIEDHGLFFEELFFAHDFRGVEIILGKFNPEFGFAWDAAPGIYGVDFAEDYELTERLGGAVNIPVLNGEHNLHFALFQADRTILSDSFGKERGQTNILAGGPSNTNSPASFSTSLSGTFGNAEYNLGFQHQQRGDGDVNDQNGTVAGVIYDFGVVNVVAEVAFFHGFEGTSDDALYTTLGASVPLGPVTFSGVYSMRDVERAPTDRLFTVSGEYGFTDNVSASLGYRFGDEGGVESQTFGTLIVVEF
ncbi:MAG: porin [Pseudomonadota bacterium]